jgi:hypothetical protein
MPADFKYPQPPSEDSTGGLIQSPEINSAGKPTQKSIKNADMGRNVVQTIIAAGRNRSIVASRIMAKYNAERPWDQHQLVSEGLGWKQNFTSKPLPMMIEKVAPRFTQAVDGLKYFTNATLSNKWENPTEKSEKFRKKITEVIRGRKGWKTLLEDIAFTNALFGNAVAAHLDEFTWFPQRFMYDEAFLPDGTKAEVQYCQAAVLKEVYLPHELFAKIEDKEAADAVGWNIKNAIELINTASPAQIRDQLSVGGTQEMWYQNAVRELTVGASYMAGASVINVYTLLVREVTGKISHYRFGGTALLEVFSKDDRFDSAEDCLAFFSFQKGNGTMAGSKGVGRDIYELAGMLDRTRNEIVDRSLLSGKTLFQGDFRQIHKFKMNLIGAAAIVPNGWTPLEMKIDGNIEPFLKLDSYFVALADQLIGSVSPLNVATEAGEGMRSPAAWNLLAAREEEGKDAKIIRFLEQFVCLVQSMQRRICDPETIEKDAKEAQKELLEIMTREELDELAKQPVAGTVRDLTPMERQMVAAVVAEKRGNPLYNQRALEVEDVTARIGADFVDRVLMPENDPTVQAEQLRQQQLELQLLQAGQAVPVSPRDNHIIHLQTLMPVAEQVGAAILQGQADTALLEVMVAHINEHVNNAQQQGTPKEVLEPFLEFVNKAGTALAKMKELDAQAEQLSAQTQAHDAESQALLAGSSPQPL